MGGREADGHRLWSHRVVASNGFVLKTLDGAERLYPLGPCAATLLLEVSLRPN